MHCIKKSIYILLGSLSLVLGILGVFLPILPTTPLIMLSCYLYSRSSKYFHMWLVSTNLYKKHAKDFMENHRLSIGKKVFLLSFASTMLLFPLFILDGILKLFIIGTYLYLYYYFLFKIKTIKQPLEDLSC
ncbi:YbaN family protein [Niameybacter sp.]|uniref:YbaN family protein n=1 Tax=Niameybacter sp. TaxID=2033640 RepID=UPI003FA59802